MSRFKVWLKGKEREISIFDLQIVYDELNTNEVALKASGIFPITHALLANVKNTFLKLYKPRQILIGNIGYV